MGQNLVDYFDSLQIGWTGGVGTTPPHRSEIHANFVWADHRPAFIRDLGDRGKIGPFEVGCSQWREQVICQSGDERAEAHTQGHGEVQYVTSHDILLETSYSLLISLSLKSSPRTLGDREVQASKVRTASPVAGARRLGRGRCFPITFAQTQQI